MAVLGIGLTAMTLASGNIFATTTQNDKTNNCNVSITEKQEELNQKVADGTITQNKIANNNKNHENVK